MHKPEDFKTQEGYEQYLASLKTTQNGWNIANMIKPESGKMVMVYTPDKTIHKSNVLLGIYWDDSDSWTVYDFESTRDLTVTHWREIPEGPYCHQ
ncbi:MAG: DUF551 domain-containing protein [Bacteroidota bacterium]